MVWVRVCFGFERVVVVVVSVLVRWSMLGLLWSATWVVTSRCCSIGVLGCSRVMLVGCWLRVSWGSSATLMLVCMSVNWMSKLLDLVMMLGWKLVSLYARSIILK